MTEGDSDVLVIRQGSYAFRVCATPFGVMLDADVLPGAEFQLMLDAVLWQATGLIPLGVAVGVPT